MRKLFCWLAVLLFLSNSMGIAAATEGAPPKDAAPSGAKKPAEKKAKTTKQARPQRLKGEITALDAEAGTVSVKSTKEEKSFLTQDAARDSLEVLRVGERVRVIYLEKDGKSVATSLRRSKVKSLNPENKQKTPSTKPATQSS